MPSPSDLLEASILRGMENNCASITCDEPLGSELMLLTGERGKGGRKGETLSLGKHSKPKSGELDQVIQQPPCGRHWVHDEWNGVLASILFSLVLEFETATPEQKRSREDPGRVTVTVVCLFALIRCFHFIFCLCVLLVCMSVHHLCA